MPYGSIEAQEDASRIPRRSWRGAKLAGMLVLGAVVLATFAVHLGGRASTVLEESEEVHSFWGDDTQSVYKDKKADPHSVGGAWMQCMRCRHASKKCHPSRSERVGRIPFRTNACPQHAGMATAAVKRHGKVRTEWVDRATLERLENEEHIEEENKGVEKQKKASRKKGKPVVLCIKPPPGKREMWTPEQDCMPIKEWLDSLDYGGDDNQGSSDDDDDTKGGSSDASKGGKKKEEKKAQSPIEKWMDGKIEEIYSQAGAGGGGAEGDSGESKEAGGTVDLNMVPPDPEDCYGPPTIECAVACMSQCLSVVNAHTTLLARRSRQQQLFMDAWGDDLPIGADRTYGDSGYDQTGWVDSVIPGGNRDFFGINNQYDGGGAARRRRVPVYAIAPVEYEIVPVQ